MPRTQIATTTLGGEPLHYVFADSASGPFGEDLAGAWLSYEQCLAEYRRIFGRYRLFGDNAILSRLPGKGDHSAAGVGARKANGWLVTIHTPSSNNPRTVRTRSKSRGAGNAGFHVAIGIALGALLLLLRDCRFDHRACARMDLSLAPLRSTAA